MIARVRFFGDDSDWLKTIDLRGINFPSDNLNMKMLRKKHPELFDLGFDADGKQQPQFFYSEEYPGHAENIVGAIMFCERLVATSAYAAARGIQWAADKVVPLSTYEDELAELYKAYGLASGNHSAAQHILNIKQQARDLANGRQA